MDKICAVCGKPFTSSQPTAKYCCFECHMEANKVRAREARREYAKHKLPAGAVKCTQAVKKKCKYGLYGAREWTCAYIEKTGHMRGCPGSECTKYEADPDRNDGRQKYKRSLSIKY